MRHLDIISLIPITLKGNCDNIFLFGSFLRPLHALTMISIISFQMRYIPIFHDCNFELKHDSSLSFIEFSYQNEYSSKELIESSKKFLESKFKFCFIFARAKLMA